jgi:hypothetical protein
VNFAFKTEVVFNSLPSLDIGSPLRIRRRHNIAKGRSQNVCYTERGIDSTKVIEGKFYENWILGDGNRKSGVGNEELGGLCSEIRESGYKLARIFLMI